MPRGDPGLLLSVAARRRCRLDQANLDDYVELDLERMANLKVDFEIGDALAKLERHELVQLVGDRYRAQPIEKALEMLDYTWDNYFKYNNPEYETPPVR